MEIITNKEEALKYFYNIVKELKEWEKEYCRNTQSLFNYEKLQELYDELKELKKISPELKKDKSFILEALKAGYFNLKSVDKSLLNDQDICLEAIKYNRNIGNVFDCIDDKLKNDNYFMEKAIKINPKSIVYVGDKLKTNQGFLDKAMVSIYLNVDKKRKEQEEKMKKLREEDECDYSGMEL